jgi:hypothetical protein
VAYGGLGWHIRGLQGWKIDALDGKNDFK